MGIYVLPTVAPQYTELNLVLINPTTGNDFDHRRIHITDFGIAYTTQLANPTGGRTVVRGCIEYLAPEILHLRTDQSTPASDMWAVGVIGYEVCLGLELTTTSEQFQEIGAYLSGQPLNLWRIPERFSQTVRHIIQTCMAMDPTVRFTAVRLRAFIQGYLTILAADVNNPARNTTFMGPGWTYA